jgi:hypothetical protein
LVKIDGSDNVTLKLPETIKATLEGNASTATTAEEAKRLDVIDGNSTKPIYFSGGVPTVCDDTLSVNIDGTSVKWANSINLNISDNEISNSGEASKIDGSGDVTLKLPKTIKATLEGNASTATTSE